MTTGDRLTYWSVLNREELQRRISIEQGRRSLSLEEQQQLDAAHERLLHWRVPSSRRMTMSQEKKEETIAHDEVAATNATPKTAEAKPAKKKPTVQREHIRGTVTKSKKSTKSEESTMRTKKKTAKKSKSNGTTKRVSEDAVLVVKKGFKNPYKEGSGPYKRFEICSKSAGKTYGQLRSMASLKTTTPNNFVKAGGGHFELAGK